MIDLLNFYQHLPEKIDPIAFSIGSFSIKWYSLMYLLVFAVVYCLLIWRIKKGEGWNELRIKNYELRNLILDLLVYCIAGLLIGARLGYVLFYNSSYFINYPLEIFLPFNVNACFIIHNSCFTGFYGMSFFGGLIGAVLAGYIFCKKHKINFFKMADFIIPVIPAGYFFGRIGNFLNGELYGRATDMSWGMYFGDGILRHPSQLYEAFFEGLILFVILWIVRNGIKYKDKMLHVPCFMLYAFGYGFFRFFIEFFREPDLQSRLFFNFLTLGQVFSLILIIFSIIAYFHNYKKCGKMPLYEQEK